MYIAQFIPEAVQNIRDLPKNTKNALKKEFRKRLLNDPINCSEPLAEPLIGFRSFHFGNYRVVYRVYEDRKAIAVVGVGKKTTDPGSDIYKRLERLANSGQLADNVLRTLRLFSTR